MKSICTKNNVHTYLLIIILLCCQFTIAGNNIEISKLKNKISTGLCNVNIPVSIEKEYKIPHSNKLLIPGSITLPDTIQSIQPPEEAKRGEGFIKKLFSKASKAEKASKKEAKNLREISEKSITVYGWHPWWMGTAYKSYDYNSLSTVSWFSIEANLSGDSTELELKNHGLLNNNGQDLIHMAWNAGCRVDVTFTATNPIAVHLLLNQPDQQKASIDSLLMILESNFKIDGICVTLENVPKGNSASILRFMSALKKALTKSKYTIKLGLPAIDFHKNYDILKLNNLVDSYILMAYDYHYKGSKLGAVSPMDGDENELYVKKSVKEYLKSGVPYNKFIVALPYYGIEWKMNPDSTKHSFHKHKTYSQIYAKLKSLNPTISLDTKSNTYYYDYSDNGINYRCYFDNDITLARKYKWLINQGIDGIGIWALGYDKDTEDFKKMFDKHFEVRKLPPLKKTLLISEKVTRDSLFQYVLIDDSIHIRSFKIRDSIITKLVKDSTRVDTLLGNITTTKNGKDNGKESGENILIQLTEKFQDTFEPVIKSTAIIIAVIIILVVFGFVGFLSSLLFTSVRELVYIRTIPSYIAANIGLILCGILMYHFLISIQRDIQSFHPKYFEEFIRAFWIILISAWLIINLLSYQLLGNISFKHDKP